MFKPVTITVDEKLLAKIDAYAKENGYNRSSLMSFCCDQYLKAKTIEPELKLALENLASAMESLSKKVENSKSKN